MACAPVLDKPEINDAICAWQGSFEIFANSKRGAGMNMNPVWSGMHTLCIDAQDENELRKLDTPAMYARLAAAVETASQPVTEVTEDESLANCQYVLQHFEDSWAYWDPDIQDRLRCFAVWEAGQAVSLTPLGRLFIPHILNAILQLRNQHAYPGSPFRHICQGFQVFRTSPNFQHVCQQVVDSSASALTNHHLQCVAGLLLDRHIQPTCSNLGEQPLSTAAAIAPILSEQAAVTYYRGGWALRSCIRAECRLTHPDQAFIDAVKATCTDKSAAFLPEAHLTAERDRGKVMYMKQPVFEVVLEIEELARQYFTDAYQIDSHGYEQLTAALATSAELRTAWCSACTVVGIPAFDEADMAIISSMYTKLVLKWLHVWQKEMLAAMASERRMHRPSMQML